MKQYCRGRQIVYVLGALAYGTTVLPADSARRHDEAVGITQVVEREVPGGHITVNISSPHEEMHIRVYREHDHERDEEVREYSFVFTRPIDVEEPFSMARGLQVGTVFRITARNEHENDEEEAVPVAVIEKRGHRRHTTALLCSCSHQIFDLMPVDYGGNNDPLWQDNSFLRTNLQRALATEQAQLFFSVYHWIPFSIYFTLDEKVPVTANFSLYWLTHYMRYCAERKWRLANQEVRGFGE